MRLEVEGEEMFKSTQAVAHRAQIIISSDTKSVKGSLKLYHNIGEGDWLDQPSSIPGLRGDLFNNFQGCAAEHQGR